MEAYTQNGDVVYTQCSKVLKLCSSKINVNIPPGYHHNGIAATHALGLIMYDYTFVVPMSQKIAQQARWVEMFNESHGLLGSYIQIVKTWCEII